MKDNNLWIDYVPRGPNLLGADNACRYQAYILWGPRLGQGAKKDECIYGFYETKAEAEEALKKEAARKGNTHPKRGS